MRTIFCVGLVVTLVLNARGQEGRSGTPLKVSTRAEIVGENGSALAREPMVVETARGTLFLAGYGSNNPNEMPRLWRSDDHGKTWSRVKVGTEAEGAIGNSDVDLAVAPNGTIYFASMGFRWPEGLEGTHITVGVSKDEGKTWKWNVLTREKKVDRPWVAVAPDGKAYVIWNDGKSVFCARSTDDGANWTTGTVSDSGGGSSHVAVGPKGEIAVRLTPVSQSGSGFTSGMDVVAVSTDGGKTWEKRVAPGERDWKPMEKSGTEDTPRWVEPLAWDAKGRLYSLWTNKKVVWLARSGDLGKNWKTWKVSDCSEMCFFPYFVVKGDELGATWMSGNEKKMWFHVARIKMGEDGPTEVSSGGPVELDVWEKNTDKPGNPVEAAGGGEYDAVVFLQDGKLGVVTPVQDEGKKKFGFQFLEFGSK